MSVALPPFQNLVDAHWRDVARLAHALAGPDDAEDVAQLAWTKALAAYPDLRSAANLRGWLLTVVARTATDAHRARGRRPVPVPELPDRAGPGSPAAPDPAVWAAVRALPERQRTAVALKYVVDLDHAAIAAHLGTTPAASRRLVADALAALRKDLL
ncbi:RNA polymerase sigma factor [Spongisporangium articulatum]|uniref:RNA polymerase sigma factor n=1 Tax=Spongisporangium articulatum TaxID=3362603 RepID=A0ABW8AIA9_9ACTN